MSRLGAFFSAVQVSVVFGALLYDAVTPHQYRAWRLAILGGLTLLLLLGWVHRVFADNHSTDTQKGTE